MAVTASPKPKGSNPWRFWKTMRHVFICCTPVKPSSSRRKGNAAVAATVSPLRSNLGSPLPSPEHAYSTMNAAERDENLKEVIAYCNKSMELVL
ncbi:hypothetical protein V6N13_107634 [Hibiscus sabdariffa]|uniref:Uncharacterized protein n=2 Tax=Hibiscus sabdariffa TaxID=183260 RepID=A0ABR1Z832_9ROSI